MLRRLRVKFILTNMLLVTAVLLVVFSVLVVSTSRQLESESTQAMSMALSQGGTPPKLEVKRPDRAVRQGWQLVIPVFCVSVQEDGTLVMENGERVHVSQEVLEQAVQEVLSGETERGSLQKLGLRFQLKHHQDGTAQLAFSDLSWERAYMTRLTLVSLLVGMGALAVFFAASLALSRLVLRPVEQTWTRQRQFLADASHELKTPLTVILANTSIIGAHPNDTVAAQQKWLDYIQEEAQRMKNLVEDMLFLAKHDDAKRSGHMEAVNFSDLVTGCTLRFESVAFERGTTLNVQIQPDLKTMGNPVDLERLVMILLDNAVKYAGEHGQVDTVLSGGPEKLLLTVRNTGDPIPPEHLEHLFERFYRVDGSRSRKEGGYGLGLAIAKTILDSYRGQIEVSSNREQGTVFLVTLPLRK